MLGCNIVVLIFVNFRLRPKGGFRRKFASQSPRLLLPWNL